ncbi:MAG: FG-GAP-like repeat-containing protein [Pyrinomonadaceae bacterium]
MALTSPGSTTTLSVTGADGSYSFGGLRDGDSFTITPSKSNYTFSPPSRSFDNLTSGATADFVGTVRRFTIQGVIKDGLGAGILGVTVSLAGTSSATATTDGNGTYSFQSLAGGGSYTVKPTLQGAAFSPLSTTFSNLSSDRTANFTGQFPSVVISGVVRDAVAGVGLSGLRVMLTGSKTSSADTFTEGGYSFFGVPAGGTYSVTLSPNPSNSLFTPIITPPPVSRSFSRVSSNLRADFDARLLVNKIGKVPGGLSLGDFDGDGKLDVAFGDSNNGVGVLLGHGDGTFRAQPTAGGGTLPREVVAADFNGDGKLDLASVGLKDQNARVFFGNGDGTFQTPTGYAVINTPVSLTAKDFDGDGRIDLAVVCASDQLTDAPPTLSVLLNAGAGAFRPALNSNLKFQPAHVMTDDFNSDGKPDLLVADQGISVTVLLGDGSGHFGMPLDFEVGGNPSVLTHGDFNGDKKPDVAFMVNAPRDAFPSYVFILLGKGDGGFVKFDEKVTVGHQVSVLSAGDFNRDGKLDLAAATYNISGGPQEIKPYYGDGDGTFTDAKGLSLEPIQGSPDFAAVGDVDDDGAPDLVIANMRNDGADSGTAFANAGVLLNATSMPTVQFAAADSSVSEGDGSVTVSVVRSGDASGPATVDYSTSNGSASDRSDYTAVFGTLRYAPGETSKTVTVFVSDDAFVESPERFTVGLSNPSGINLGPVSIATVTVGSDDVAPVTSVSNPLEDPLFYVRQHYREFLNRDPDPAGLQFWMNEITKCGADARCREVKRINVSAAFFLSIEFQETGYLVYRFYKAAYGNQAGSPVPVRLREFLTDTPAISQGVQVNVGDWQQQLEANKNAFAAEFVSRPQFTAQYPSTMTAADFVDALNANSGGALSAAERNQLVRDLSSGVKTRAQVLRAVAEDSDLAQAEFNKAFVLMQYFGYLRRNPDDPPDRDFSGWQFWLDKLNQFDGNYIQAEMVKAFLDSIEYRKRFGQ